MNIVLPGRLVWWVQKFINFIQYYRDWKQYHKRVKDHSWDSYITKLKAGRKACMSCGYDGEEIQGEYPDLYRGYGCPKCHSPLVMEVNDS